MNFDEYSARIAYNKDIQDRKIARAVALGPNLKVPSKHQLIVIEFWSVKLELIPRQHGAPENILRTPSGYPQDILWRFSSVIPRNSNLKKLWSIVISRSAMQMQCNACVR